MEKEKMYPVYLHSKCVGYVKEEYLSFVATAFRLAEEKSYDVGNHTISEEFMEVNVNIMNILRGM